MYSFSHRPAFAVRCIVALAVVLAAGSAAAVYRKADLGLTQQGATCDGKGTYGYTATWKGVTGATSHGINTGNQCTLNGAVCGISNQACYAANCAAGATCSVTLKHCIAGKGAPWVGVTAAGAQLYQRISASGPGNCQ
jgi:hypothetical protein